MKISVVISTYNAGRYLRAAVDSILGQDFPNRHEGDFECIVVDDGSTDNTPELLAAYDDPRLKAFRLPANCGIGIARNVGIRYATGEYIAIMDADDIAFPQRLLRQSQFLDEPSDIHFLGTRTVRVRESLENIINRPPHPVEDAIIKARLLLLNGTAMINPTTMFRRDFMEKHRLLYPARSVDEDHELWIQCMAAGARFHTLEDILLYKRRHQHNITLTMAGTKEAGKVPLRAMLIGLFHPHLTSLARALALLFYQGVKLTPELVRAGVEAGRKAMTDSRSYYGESRQQLREILSICLNMASNALAQHRARS